MKFKHYHGSYKYSGSTKISYFGNDWMGCQMVDTLKYGVAVKIIGYAYFGRGLLLLEVLFSDFLIPFFFNYCWIIPINACLNLVGVLWCPLMKKTFAIDSSEGLQIQ